MRSPTLVTPLNWFEVWQSASGPDGDRRFTLIDARGEAPLGDVRIDELLAVHRSYGSWRAERDSEAARDSVRHLEDLLAQSRTLVERRAHDVLDVLNDAVTPSSATLGFPTLSSPLLADSRAALYFLRNFLGLAHAPSLLAWARTLTSAPDAVATCRAQAWMRLLLQKLVVDDDDPGARACLREVYAAPDAAAAYLSDERDAVAATGLPTLLTLADTLGLARPPRVGRWPASGRRPAPPEGRADFTVVVPSYRHEAFIDATLESVLSQTDPSFRIAVVDDRSPDATAQRAAQIGDPRVSVTVNQATLGLGNSFLGALERVDTPYVALLNSDDVFAPERLARCRAHLDGHPAAQVIATGVVPIDAEGHPLTVATVRPLVDGRHITDWLRWFADHGGVAPDSDLLASLLERNFLVTSSNIVARTAFLRACAPLLEGLQFCLDWQVFLSAAAVGGLVYDPAPLLGYRLHGSNTVWFDEERAVAYRLEANRVLEATLEAVRPRDLRDPAATVRFLTQASRHAARHSDANGLAMAVIGKLSGDGLERARAGSPEVHRAIGEIVHDETGRAAARAQLAQYLRTTAWQALADIARESAAAAWGEAEANRHAAAESERRVSALTTEVTEALTRAATEHAEAVSKLKAAPEWLLGDRLWNRLGLSRIGEPAVRALHAARDLRNRGSLAVRGLARRLGLAKPGAVVAACWSFPIHSQTFVYQEMSALAWAGLDYRVFCCDTNPRSELPSAFAGLWDKRLVMQADWKRGQRDLAHFRRTRPARVASLLATLARATGRSEASLLEESIVLAGFTFARHLELNDTRYVHTYFFYDQSFLGLMAAYLLEIPRGITAYADHMLGDYPFKLVPLHLELADIVVATSARIKDELGEIGGGRFDDKIIVKPNGIDVARFRYVPAAERLAAAGVPELIAINRIEPKKGLIHLVEAMALLRDRGIAARANIVGGVDLNTPTSAACHRELVARIDALGLRDAVILHGVKQQHEFAPMAARARMFVAPYVEVGSGDKDGIPTAVLEAMSTGLPIVTTDAGSIVEASRPGIEALVVPQRDAAALADAIARLLTDREIYVRMSEAARARAVDEFDITVTEVRLHERIARALAARA